MTTFREFFSYFHLAAGAIALVSFWFPLFTRKGARFHRTAGWIFVGAMSVILVSAAAMTVERVLGGNRDFALFLGFLTLITFSAVWGGIVVLRRKAGPHLMRTPFDFAILVLIGLAGLILLWQWWQTRFPLLLVFGALGVLIAIPEMLKWRKPAPVVPRYWFYHHLESMITAGMAAHIAFFAFGSTRLWPDLYAGQPWWLMLIPWVAPFPIAFAAIALLKRHYQKRTGAPLTARS
jgi:uncharacterized membrane protein